MPETSFDADDDLDYDGIGDASTLLKKLRQQVKEQGKSLANLENENKSLKSRDRERTLGDALKAAGFSDKVAKFYPADAELTADAVASWISDNTDVFGVAKSNDEQPAEPGPGEGEPETPAEQPTYDYSTEIALRRMQLASNGGSVPTTVATDLQRRIYQAKSPEELTEVLSQAPRR